MKRKGGKGLKYILIFAVCVAVVVLILGNSARLMFPLKYGEYISKYSSRSDVDPFLVLAIIKVESNFDPKAVSSKKARGLMQISEKTGEWGARVLRLGDYKQDSLFDPETNISIGSWYLDVLYKEFNGDTRLVLAAYNGGSGNVNEWLKNRSYSSSGKSLDRIPFRETEQYVGKVMNCRAIYKKLYENAF